MRRIFGMVALCVLGACSEGTELGNLELPGMDLKPAPETVEVSGGDVVIAGPSGFCVDPEATKDNARSAFVLMGSCAAISNSPFRPQPFVPAILMATISSKTETASIASSMETLAGFFKSEDGRAALSRDGRASTVEVIQTVGKDGVFYIHARDSSEDTLQGAGDEYWRALFDLKGRIVSASVVGLEAKPISASVGFNTLEQFVGRIKAANTATGGAQPVTKPTPSFLNRLLKLN